jgi:hypothetical protein
MLFHFGRTRLGTWQAPTFMNIADALSPKLSSPGLADHTNFEHCRCKCLETDDPKFLNFGQVFLLCNGRNSCCSKII